MKQEQQLTMDFAAPPKTEETGEEVSEYEALDHQLATLMQQLNGELNQTLENCTCEISKYTQEGIIAIACADLQQQELLKTKVVGKAGDYKPLILDSGYLYLRRYWQYQQQLAERIQSRTMPCEVSKEELDWQMERLNHYFGDENNEGEIDWQRVAVERALNHDFLILSGGPGTGKTTTITKLLVLAIEQRLASKEGYLSTSPKNGDISELSVSNDETASSLKSGGGVSLKFTISLAAPTGKAAIRMLDAIHEAQQALELSDVVQRLMPVEASTLHKLLGYQHGSVSFKHNRDNPLNTDIVLIDEASMVDIALMSKLLEAVPAHATLVLIGDKDQLSSVETGSVFADMCAGLESTDNLVTLQKNWRFDNNSGIGQLALAANTGNSKELINVLQDDTYPECTLISPLISSEKQLPKNFLAPWQHYFTAINDKQSSLSDIFHAFNQFRVLCALRRGLNGSTIISERIETSLAKLGLINKGKAQNKIWYHGRPVMITQNSYSKGLFNGDTGITLIKNGETKVYFPDVEEQGGYKSIAPVRLPAHETTWAMTIHKSQGSEFDQVILVLPNEVMPLLTRQLIYTGITRAKRNIMIVSSEDILKVGVESDATQATQIEALLTN